jgi:hypothetical protein
MNLTNGQRGDLIDAFEMAIEFCNSLINSNLPPRNWPKVWTQEDRDNRAEWSGQLKRFRKLRRAYLAEERRALREFPTDKARK